jgi:alpha-1,3-rhamnosyltransferase
MENKQPLVSIFIFSYNHAKFIEECIASVFEQTYKNIEVYVIDDASTDNIDQIIENLKEKYKFNYIKNIENKGYVKNLNKYLPLYAKGEFVCIVAADDKWTPDKIEKQVNFLNNNPDISACWANVYVIDENSSIIGSFSDTNTNYTFEDVFLINHILPALTFIIRNQVLKEINFYDENYLLEDWPLILKLLSNNYKIHKLNDILGYYRIHSNNVHKINLWLYEEQKKIIEIYRSHILYPKAKRKIIKVWFPNLVVFNKVEALKYIFYAFDFSLTYLKSIIKLFIPKIIIFYIRKNKG